MARVQIDGNSSGAGLASIGDSRDSASSSIIPAKRVRRPLRSLVGILAVYLARMPDSEMLPTVDCSPLTRTIGQVDFSFSDPASASQRD